MIVAIFVHHGLHRDLEKLPKISLRNYTAGLRQTETCEGFPHVVQYKHSHFVPTMNGCCCEAGTVGT